MSAHPDQRRVEASYGRARHAVKEDEMTETAEERLIRATDVLVRLQDDAAHGRVTSADVHRAQEDRDTALRAYEQSQQLIDTKRSER